VWPAAAILVWPEPAALVDNIGSQGREGRRLCVSEQSPAARPTLFTRDFVGGVWCSEMWGVYMFIAAVGKCFPFVHIAAAESSRLRGFSSKVNLSKSKQAGTGNQSTRGPFQEHGWFLSLPFPSTPLLFVHHTSLLDNICTTNHSRLSSHSYRPPRPVTTRAPLAMSGAPTASSLGPPFFSPAAAAAPAAAAPAVAAAGATAAAAAAAPPAVAAAPAPVGGGEKDRRLEGRGSELVFAHSAPPCPSSCCCCCCCCCCCPGCGCGW
jgi:hypothetical protein